MEDIYATTPLRATIYSNPAWESRVKIAIMAA
jgi:hypothetical protein